MPLRNTIKDLIFSPGLLALRYKEGQITHQDVFFQAILFMVAASLCFALAAVLYYQEPLTGLQALIRFCFFFGLMFLLVIPISTGIWGILQKLSSWYWNLEVPLPHLLGLAGLGIFYYAAIFLLSLLLLVVRPFAPFIVEGILFALNLAAAFLSFRLFQQTYSTLTPASGKKAWFVSLFPVIIVLGLYIAIQVLVYFAMMPHLRGR